jgi:hypothetical protein
VIFSKDATMRSCICGSPASTAFSLAHLTVLMDFGFHYHFGYKDAETPVWMALHAVSRPVVRDGPRLHPLRPQQPTTILPVTSGERRSMSNLTFKPDDISTEVWMGVGGVMLVLLRSIIDGTRRTALQLLAGCVFGGLGAMAAGFVWGQSHYVYSDLRCCRRRDREHRDRLLQHVAAVRLRTRK